MNKEKKIKTGTSLASCHRHQRKTKQQSVKKIIHVSNRHLSLDTFLLIFRG